MFFCVYADTIAGARYGFHNVIDFQYSDIYSF